MLTWRRFKQTLSLSERLLQNVEHLREQLATLPPGPKRDHFIKRICLNGTAADIDQWLKSTGLQLPLAVEHPGK